MLKQLINSIDLDINKIQASWPELKEQILTLKPSEQFPDTQRLKMFVSNFFEYFREYDILKDCSEDEYLAVLYYIVKSNEGHGQTIQGEELKMLIRILSRLRENF